jgi:hypothetical protein
VYIKDDCVSLDIGQAGGVGAAGQPLTAVLLPGHDVDDAHRHIVIRRGHLCHYYFYYFFTVLLTVFQTILMWVRTVKSANFVRGSKLRHFNGEFLWSTARFTSPDINIFKNVPFFKYFSLLIFLCKKWSI